MSCKFHRQADDHSNDGEDSSDDHDLFSMFSVLRRVGINPFTVRKRFFVGCQVKSDQDA